MSNEEATHQLCLEALNGVHDILLDSTRNCVDRVNAAWSQLQHLSLPDFAPALREEWTSLSERASRLAAGPSGPTAQSSVDEAGDVGSIVLCIESLLRSDVFAASTLSLIGQQSNGSTPHRKGHQKTLAEALTPRQTSPAEITTLLES